MPVQCCASGGVSENVEVKKCEDHVRKIRRTKPGGSNVFLMIVQLARRPGSIAVCKVSICSENKDNETMRITVIGSWQSNLVTKICSYGVGAFGRHQSAWLPGCSMTVSCVLRRSAAQKSPVLVFVYVLLQELLHHVHDGHHISQPDRDSHGDSVSGRTQRAGVGGLQRVFRHAVPDRCGSEFPNGHHYRGQWGESGCTLFSDTIWETIIPAQTSTYNPSLPHL